MTHRILALLVAAFALAIAPIANQATTPDLALVGAKIYPSPTAPPIDVGTVIIHAGRIQTVGTTAAIRIPAGTAMLDCQGLVVTAGFWNNHVHILTPGLLEARESPATGLQPELDTLFNRWGFTTVFDLASVLDNTVALKHRIESGELRGPRILTTGEPIWTIEPVYIRNFLEAHRLSFPNSTTSEQALALVRDHVAKGVNGIKLFTGSYQGNGKVEALPLAIARAAVTEAHGHRLPVFAHPQDTNGVGVAIDSGVDILAHTVPQSPAWDQAYVQRLRRANLALIPTLTLFDVEARKDGTSDRERDAWIARMVDELRAYSKAGGDILFGTDVGYTDHYETGLEFILMSRAGMTYRDVLASLTAAPAAKFRDANRGRIENGMDADLVVLRADPARDPGAFAKVSYTIRQGVVTYRAP